MGVVPIPKKPVEKILLDIPNHHWIALSTGGCGILTCSIIGRHEREYQEGRKVALAFAHSVVWAMSSSPAHERLSTPQLLVDAATAVIDDPEHVVLMATTWQYRPEGVEICSVGLNSLLIFEEDNVREGFSPHTVNELLKRLGKAPDPRHSFQITHALGSGKSENEHFVRADDVRVALIPLELTTTIAILAERLLVDAIIEQAVPRKELLSFIEAWTPPGNKISTGVLISM